MRKSIILVAVLAASPAAATQNIIINNNVQVGAASAAWTVTGEDDFPRNVRSSMPQLQNDLKKSALATRIRPNVLMISQLFMIRDLIPAKARGHMTLMRTIA
jgi:hypothetical protein